MRRHAPLEHAARRIAGRALPILLAVLSLAGCSSRGEPDPAKAMAVESPGEPPSIVGEITARLEGGIRVEAVPAEPSGSDKAVVGLAGARIVRRSDGAEVDAAALAIGQRVSVWFTGPVRESYPVQADAKHVVIESVPR